MTLYARHPLGTGASTCIQRVDAPAELRRPTPMVIVVMRTSSVVHPFLGARVRSRPPLPRRCHALRGR